MSGNRKFFVGGNWKMNGNLSKISELTKMLNEKGINPNTGAYNTNSVFNSYKSRISSKRHSTRRRHSGLDSDKISQDCKCKAKTTSSTKSKNTQKSNK